MLPLTEKVPIWPALSSKTSIELGLVAAVIYHSLNGLKIMLIDFFPQLVRHIRTLGIATAAAFLASMLPITYIMGRQIVDLIRKG